MRSPAPKRLREVTGLIHLAHETGVLALANMIAMKGGTMRVESKGKIYTLRVEREEPAPIVASPGAG